MAMTYNVVDTIHEIPFLVPSLLNPNGNLHPFGSIALPKWPDFSSCGHHLVGGAFGLSVFFSPQFVLGALFQICEYPREVQWIPMGQV